MRARGLVAAMAVASLAVPAGAEPGDPPAESAGGVLDRLPPGARAESLLPPVSARPPTAPGDGAEEGWTAERVAISPDGEVPAWLEVEYTVDAELEARLRAVLEKARVELGHVILMDPRTGEIYAYVSTDPERFPPTRPYPTASLMKVVTSAATLRRASEVPGGCRYVGSPYQLRASDLVPPRAGGRVDPFWRWIAISNNQCFARLALRVGRDALLDEIERVGLLEAPAALHAAGRVEPVEDDLDLGELGSGLAGSFVTPLGAARLAAVLAGGELVQPYWIAEVRTADGRPPVLVGRSTPRTIWPREMTDELRELMVSVTTRGTAKRAFHDARGAPLLGDVRVAGKTGSLHGTDPDGTYQWFIGVAPAEAPVLAVAALVVNQGTGSLGAADVAAASLRAVLCGEDGDCRASRAEALHARAQRRDAAARAEAERLEAERTRQEEELARFHSVEELDRPPHPLGDPVLDFPDWMTRRRVRGRIVLWVDIDPEGDVVDVEVASSSLGVYDEYVMSQVRDWKFTPPTREGRPVGARAQLPLQIHIR